MRRNHVKVPGPAPTGRWATSSFLAPTKRGLAKPGTRSKQLAFIGSADPTPEQQAEVEARIAQVRDAWSDSEREIRRAYDPHRDAGGWTPPVVSPSTHYSHHGQSRHEVFFNADADAMEYYVD